MIFDHFPTKAKVGPILTDKYRNRGKTRKVIGFENSNEINTITKSSESLYNQQKTMKNKRLIDLTQ